MSEDLLRKLRLLEEEYASQPPVARQADLQEINRMRSQLGLPLVDACLNETAAGAGKEDGKKVATPEPEQVEDHTEARELYQTYLKKREELEVHRAYAEEVARATSGPGQTPVRPLATMGTNGGPLLCDYCEKPIVLEGGRSHGVTADVAWKKNPTSNWKSWILGGMVVEIQTNGTLRIYHGYPDRNTKDCCNIASRQNEKASAEHDSSKGNDKMLMLLAFIEKEFPDLPGKEQADLLNDIMNTLYGYDPGIGINRPCTQR